jgi:dipeptidyl aminopeptidase/acylaminoacyl peptidase
MCHGARSRTLLAILMMVLVSLPLASLAQSQDSDKDDKGKKKEEELPLKTAETIEFTTNEGTWMSLDISPDGQTMVFDLLGDIYTLPVAGGTAKRIIGGLSFESQPKFSPDGKMIALLSDRGGAENVWVAAPDGSNLKSLTTGRNQAFCSPSWTPTVNM